MKPKIKEGLNNVVANEWLKVRFCVDSVAGETVMAEEDRPEVETKESWGSKRGQSYEVANGDEIDNEGEKTFVAHMLTINGADSGGRGIVAQVCKVHRPLMSVKKICNNRQKVVFDEEGSYVDNTKTKLRTPLREEGCVCVFDMLGPSWATKFTL